MTPVQQAIEALYQAFSDQPKPLDIEGCIHCVSRELIEGMLSTPLRQITSQQIGKYASSVLNTVGSDADYLYYLPRILELSATDIYWPTDIELNGRHIKQTDLAQWPAARKQALIAYFHAVLEQIFTEEAYDDEEDAQLYADGETDDIPVPMRTLDEWICSIGNTGLDLQPFLEQIMQHPIHCVALYQYNTMGSEIRTNAFWYEDEPNSQIFLDWLQSAELQHIIEQRYAKRNQG